MHCRDDSAYIVRTHLRLRSDVHHNLSASIRSGIVSMMYPYIPIFLLCPCFCAGTPIAQMAWEQGGMNTSSEARNESTRDVRNGWVSEPKGRGTWSILLSCLMTLFICAWTAYHPNIAKGSRSIWSKVSKRVKWLFMATLFPEAIVYCALAQLMAAKQLQYEVNKIGENEAYGTRSTNVGL